MHYKVCASCGKHSRGSELRCWNCQSVTFLTHEIPNVGAGGSLTAGRVKSQAEPDEVDAIKAAERHQDSMKQCPFCAEDIRGAAIKCKHCGSSLIEAPDDAAALARPRYRDESAFGAVAIVCYLMFTMGMIAVNDVFGQFAVAMMLTSSIVWSIIANSIGRQKGRPVRGFLLGLALGPIGLLVVALQK